MAVVTDETHSLFHDSAANARSAERTRSEVPPIGPLALIPAVLADFGVSADEVLASCWASAGQLDDLEGVLPYAISAFLPPPIE